jgi:hypothetical protein
MYRKEFNERSPMRVFEESIQGGLGRGNVGVVVARPGVGKTALLVQIALDGLLRDKRVLHISNGHAVDHVRAYYDEIFNDLAVTHQLAQPQMVRLEIERNRLIYSHLEATAAAPPSSRGGSAAIDRIESTIAFAKEYAQFEPDILIIDGWDFDQATSDTVAALGELADKLSAELWLAATTEEYATETPLAGPDSTPTPLRRFFDLISVIVLLRPADGTVHLELLKDHDNGDVSDLKLQLDPATMRVVDENVPPRSRQPKDPRRFHLVSGGARGAEATFGRCAEQWQVRETHYSFEGHRGLERERGVVVLNEDELKRGDFSLVYASHRLGRPLSEIPNIKRILQTMWHQITIAGQVFVIGALQDNGTVRGGTGWGAELARLWNKPVFVYDQERGSWFRWDGTEWRSEDSPVIERTTFAGIGTTRLTDGGAAAIRKLFENSFGPPPP